MQNKNANICSHWQIWKVIHNLEHNGISSSLPSEVSSLYRPITLQVIQIFREWGEQYAGHRAWNSLLNKSSLEHEAEESIIALYHLQEWLNSQSKESTPEITVVDCCCGKGLFSVLLSYMVGMFWKDSAISNIVMMDKAIHIDWEYVDCANMTAAQENRPQLILWNGINLHQYDQILDRLLHLETTLALVGIHLCKTLSLSAISLMHGLGPKVCPFLCLAPCCMPRIVTSQNEQLENRRVGIYQYETPEDRALRRGAMAQRDRALGRDRRHLCYICNKGHRVRQCPSLEGLSDSDRHAVLQDASQRIPCWKCGIVGHFKANCPNIIDKNLGNVLLYQEPPISYWNIPSVITSAQPFEDYCQVLADCLRETASNVVLHDLKFQNYKSQQHVCKESHWNQMRKSVFIIAQSHTCSTKNRM